MPTPKPPPDIPNRRALARRFLWSQPDRRSDLQRWMPDSESANLGIPEESATLWERRHHSFEGAEFTLQAKRFARCVRSPGSEGHGRCQPSRGRPTGRDVLYVYFVEQFFRFGSGGIELAKRLVGVA